MGRPLFRQPGGFEGFGRVQEALGPDHLATSKREYPTRGGVDLQSAPATTGADVAEGDDAITQIAVLRELGNELLEGLHHVGVPAAQTVMAAIHVPLGAPD